MTLLYCLLALLLAWNTPDLVRSIPAYRRWRGGYWYRCTGMFFGKNWLRCDSHQGGEPNEFHPACRCRLVDTEGSEE